MTHLVDILLGKKTIPAYLPALKYGRETEPEGKRQVIAMLRSQGHKNIKGHDCGLYVFSDMPYLGASPDLVEWNASAVALIFN